jgi:hypothetical protein
MWKRGTAGEGTFRRLNVQQAARLLKRLIRRSPVSNYSYQQAGSLLYFAG